MRRRGRHPAQPPSSWPMETGRPICAASARSIGPRNSPTAGSRTWRATSISEAPAHHSNTSANAARANARRSRSAVRGGDTETATGGGGAAAEPESCVFREMLDSCVAHRHDRHAGRLRGRIKWMSLRYRRALRRDGRILPTIRVRTGATPCPPSPAPARQACPRKCSRPGACRAICRACSTASPGSDPRWSRACRHRSAKPRCSASLPNASRCTAVGTPRCAPPCASCGPGCCATSSCAIWRSPPRWPRSPRP